jgi:hypothetical protein
MIINDLIVESIRIGFVPVYFHNFLVPSNIYKMKKNLCDFSCLRSVQDLYFTTKYDDEGQTDTAFY